MIYHLLAALPGLFALAVLLALWVVASAIAP